MSKRMLTTAVLAVVACSAFGFLANDAQGAIKPASGGVAWLNSDINCFNRSWARVNNTCTTTRTFLVPLEMRTTGSKTFTARAYGAYSTDRVSCSVTVNNGNNSQTWFSGWVGTSGLSASYQTLTVGTRTIAAGETAQFECNIDGPGLTQADLVNVSWTD